MPLDDFDRAGFAMLDMTRAGPGALAAVEGMAIAPVLLLPILVAGLWLFGRRDTRRTGVLAGSAGIVAMVMAHVASTVIHRPRPFVAGLAPNVLVHAADSSFPSDHATLFFALAAVLVRRPVPALPGPGWALACLGVAVGLARVSLGVHFPLDVADAALIGIVAALSTERVGRAAVDALFRVGERARLPISFLAARDGRENADAHPAR